jgi:hypothetical protein
VEECERRATAEPFAQVPLGEPPLRLLQDAVRRLTALAALPHPVHPDRERPVRSGTAGGSGALRREVLAHADGRSTARDLAFRIGRGVYTVTVEVARMLEEGLLVCAGPPAPVAVRSLLDGDELRPRRPPPVERPPSPVRTDLPRRKPGGFFRLRNGTPK